MFIHFFNCWHALFKYLKIIYLFLTILIKKSQNMLQKEKSPAQRGKNNPLKKNSIHHAEDS